MKSDAVRCKSVVANVRGCAEEWTTPDLAIRSFQNGNPTSTVSKRAIWPKIMKRLP